MGMRGFRPLKKPWFWKEPRFLRPGCSIIRASLTVALMVSLPRSRSLFHLRWQVPTGHTLSFAPSDARNAHEKCCGIRLWGAERKRVPCGHLGPKGPKRPGGGERNERRARPAPTATIERPGVCPKPRQARREACALWALGPKAQSDPQRGSETMSATVREARMIEQPGRPLHPIHSPCLPSLSQYSGRTCSNLSPYLSGSPPAKVSRRA